MNDKDVKPFMVLPLLSESVCDAMLPYVQKVQFNPVVIAERNGTVKPIAKPGVCSAGFGQGSPLYKLFSEQLTPHYPAIEEYFGFDLFDQSKRLPLVAVGRYLPEANDITELEDHVDVGPFPGLSDRKLTVCLVLNHPEEFEGGEFSIYDGCRYFPHRGKSRGTAVIFPSYMVHSVGQLLSGKRYSCFAWLKGPQFR